MRDKKMDRFWKPVACAFLFLAVLLAWDGRLLAQKGPDLVVAAIECNSESGKLGFTVVNQGSAPLPAGWRSLADVYFDGVKKAFFDLGAPTSGNIGPAGGKAYYLTVLDITGPVTVRVVADSVNGIRETNERNNERVQNLKPCVKPKLPDLVVRIVGPASARPGQNIGPMIKVTVTNIGTVVALGTDSSREGYMVDVVLSGDGILPVHPAVVSPFFIEDMLLEGGRISNTVTLAPGASTSYSLAGGAGVTLPLKVNPGKYCLGAVVDPFTSVNELREDNNTGCSPIVMK